MFERSILGSCQLLVASCQWLTTNEPPTDDARPAGRATVAYRTSFESFSTRIDRMWGMPSSVALEWVRDNTAGRRKDSSVRNIRFARLLALATFIVAATGSPPTALSAATRPATDDPLATAVAFDEAMRRGDLQVVQSLSLTTRDDHGELLKALVSWGETYTHLENAALKAFGEQ